MAEKARKMGELAAFDAAYAALMQQGLTPEALYVGTFVAVTAEGIFGGSADAALKRYCEKRPDRTEVGVWQDLRASLNRLGISIGVEEFVRNAVRSAMDMEPPYRVTPEEAAAVDEIAALQEELRQLCGSMKKGRGSR